MSIPIELNGHIRVFAPWEHGLSLDPESARRLAHRWGEDRMLPAEVSATLADLAALGVQLALVSWPTLVELDLDWRGPDQVTVSVGWRPSQQGDDDTPPEIVGEIFDDLTVEWSLEHGAAHTSLLLVVDAPPGRG